MDVVLTSVLSPDLPSSPHICSSTSVPGPSSPPIRSSYPNSSLVAANPFRHFKNPGSPSTSTFFNFLLAIESTLFTLFSILSQHIRHHGFPFSLPAQAQGHRGGLRQLVSKNNKRSPLCRAMLMSR